MPEDFITIVIRRESDVMMASMSAMRMTEKHGMSAVLCTMCATAVSELATNIVRYAEQGEVGIYVQNSTFHIVAKDQGAGIANVDLAMQEGHSGGSGLGLGLSGVARMMDKLDIETELGLGTCVRASKAFGLSREKTTWQSLVTPRQTVAPVTASTPEMVAKQARHDVDSAMLLRPMAGEVESGDGGLLLDVHGDDFMALWDVSGHGKEAHALSLQVKAFIMSRQTKPPHILLRDVHEKFKGSRGLVAVIARFHRRNCQVEYAGVGNISLLHFDAQGMHHLALQEGVMGYQIRTPVAYRLILKKGDTLVMHSDGIRTLREGQFHLQGATAADMSKHILELYRAKQQDDAACLVFRHKR